MRMALSTVALFVLSPIVNAGPIADQFAHGFAAVPWGTSLAQVVEKYPGGGHFLTGGSACRIYSVQAEDPLLGIPRVGSMTLFGYGLDRKLDVMGIDIPYAQRNQLFKSLTRAFGPYAAMKEANGTIGYAWKPDAGIQLNVWETQDPDLGVVQVWIYGPSYTESNRCSPPAVSALGSPGPQRSSR